jgi:hypothetical protein
MKKQRKMKITLLSICFLVVANVCFLQASPSLLPTEGNAAQQQNITVTGTVKDTNLVAAKTGKKIFVIIDEYDHFANDLIAQGSSSGDDFYRSVIRANGTVRDFYESLKAGGKSFIDRSLPDRFLKPVRFD